MNVWTDIMRVALKARSLLVCLALAAGPVFAAPLLSPSSVPNTELYKTPNLWRGSQELRDVVDLLQQGEPNKARLALAEFLKRFPRDPRGPELAGMIFLEEKNYPMAEYSFQQALKLNKNQHGARSKLGITLLLQGKQREGEGELRKTLAAQPSDPLARRYMGWLEETRGNVAAAAAHYETILRYMPSLQQLSETHIALARIYNATGRYEDTLKLLSPLAKRSPGDALGTAATLALTRAYAGSGRADEAVRQLASVERRLPKDNAELLLVQADVARANKDLGTARAKLDALKKMAPAFEVIAADRLADIALIENNPQQAIKELEAAAAKVDKNDLSAILGKLAAVYIKHNQAAQAVRTLEEFAARHPELPGIKYHLAETKLAQGDKVGSLAAAKALNKAFPDFAEAFYLAGAIERELNQLEAAQADLERVVKLAPRNIKGWVALAGLHVSKKAYAAAEQTLRDALKVNAGDATLMFEVASLYEATGKQEEANKQYQQILTKHADYVPALNNLAANLAEGAELQSAKRYVERAYKLAPNEPAVQDTYGWILVLAGEGKKGLALLQTAIAGLGDDGVAHYHLGMAQIKLGNAAEGKRLLSKALALGVSESHKAKIQSSLN